MLPGKNYFVALIEQSDFDSELSPIPAGPMLDAFDLEFRVHRIVLEYRFLKCSLLLQKRDH